MELTYSPEGATSPRTVDASLLRSGDSNVFFPFDDEGCARNWLVTGAYAECECTVDDSDVAAAKNYTEIYGDPGARRKRTASAAKRSALCVLPGPLETCASNGLLVRYGSGTASDALDKQYF